MIICKDTLFNGLVVVTECANWEEATGLIEAAARSNAIYICTIRDTHSGRFRREKFPAFPELKRLRSELVERTVFS